MPIVTLAATPGHCVICITDDNLASLYYLMDFHLCQGGTDYAFIQWGCAAEGRRSHHLQRRGGWKFCESPHLFFLVRRKRPGTFDCYCCAFGARRTRGLWCASAVV